MSNRGNNSRAGLTLIEVIAALVLMGGLLVGTLTAYTRYQKLTNSLEQQQQGVKLAETLLWNWMTAGHFQSGRIPQRGSFTEAPHYHWQVIEEPLLNLTAEGTFKPRKCTLKILKHRLGSQGTEQSITQVEFLLPPVGSTPAPQPAGVTP